MPALMIVCASQAGAMIGFLIQSAAGLAVGIPIYRRLRGREMPGDMSLTGLLLSWFLGGSANAYVVWISLHWKVNFSYVYFVAAFIEIILLRRPLANAIAIVAERVKTYRFTPGQWAVALWAIFILPHALVPSYLFDECSRHVFYPKQVALFGQHIFDPGDIWAVDTEVFSQSYFTISYLLGGEYALRIANLAATVAAMLLCENFCRRMFGLLTGFFTALVLISTPLLGFIITGILLEPLNYLSMTTMMIVALECFKRLDRNTVILTFILSAVGFLYKEQAVFFAVPLAVIVTGALIMQCFHKRSYWPMTWLASGVLAAIIIVTPFLTQNYILTHNPVFPWYNGIFRSKLRPPVNWEGIRYDHSLNYNILAELTFHGEQFWEFAAVPLGINFFVLALFIPLIFIRGNNNNRILIYCLFGLFAASIFLWWKITSPNIRYFVGPLSAGSILLGLTMNAIWERIRCDRIALSLGVAALAIAMTVNAASLLNSVEYCCPYPLIEAFSKQYNNCYNLFYTEELRKVFLAAYSRFGKEGSCLLVWERYLCLSDQHIEQLGAAYARNWAATDKWRNEEDAFDWIFRKRKFSCIIMKEESSENLKIKILWSPRFRKMVNVELSYAGFLLLTPKTNVASDAQGN